MSQFYKFILIIIQYTHHSVMQKIDRTEEIDQLLMQANEPEVQPINQACTRTTVHAFRAVIVVIDLTKSVNMKDFKPSRLSIITTMLKLFFRKAKENTPVIKFALAIVENQVCKFRSRFTFCVATLMDELDKLKVQAEPGHFSMDNAIRSSLTLFEDIGNQFRKEIFIVQSSPLTKDSRDIFKTIDTLKQTGVIVNIVSMIGWTNAYLKLVQAVGGCYVTIGSGEQFRNIVTQFANPQTFRSETVTISKVKLGLCKKQNGLSERLCFCHFERCKQYFVCNNCEATICTEPPCECPICEMILVLPTDLYNHIVLNN